MSNRNWGRVTEAGELVLAPDLVGGDVPTDEANRERGYVPVSYEGPRHVDGMLARFDGWTVRDGTAVRKFRYEVSSPRGRRYSKKRFDIALADLGLFPAWDAWSSTAEAVPGSGLTVARLLADSLFMMDGDREFEAVKAAAVVRFGADVIGRVLDMSVDAEVGRYAART